jgi:hypothetical protein
VKRSPDYRDGEARNRRAARSSITLATTWPPLRWHVDPGAQTEREGLDCYAGTARERDEYSSCCGDSAHPARSISGPPLGEPPASLRACRAASVLRPVGGIDTSEVDPVGAAIREREWHLEVVRSPWLGVIVYPYSKGRNK